MRAEMLSHPAKPRKLRGWDVEAMRPTGEAGFQFEIAGGLGPIIVHDIRYNLGTEVGERNRDISITGLLQPRQATGGHAVRVRIGRFGRMATEFLWRREGEELGYCLRQ